MHKPIIFHTINIFEKMYREAPLLTPSGVKEKMLEDLERVKNNIQIELHELEEIMVFYGRSLWPYQQGFKEFHDKHLEEVAEKMLLQKLTPKLRKKCETYFLTGGNFDDLSKGGSVGFFDHDDRLELARVVLEIKTELKKQVKQKILNHHLDKYNEIVDHHFGLLESMEESIEELRLLHEREKEVNEKLAGEIYHFIKSIDHGFAKLGPAISHQHILDAPAHFLGRKEEKAKMPV